MERNNTLDTIKGIGIFLVILGHCTFPRNAFIYSFHMPLFFVISGYLYKPKFEMMPFIWNKFLRLLIPFFFFSSVFLLFECCGMIINGEENLLHYVFRSLILVCGGVCFQNNPLWFLSCLFFVFLMFRLVNSFWCILLLSILGFGLSFYHHVFPFYFNVACTAILYFKLGNWYKCSCPIRNIRWYFIIVLFFIWIGAVLWNKNFVNGESVLLGGNVLGNYFLFHISAVTGIIIFCYLCRYINCNFVTKLGRFSLIMMIIHWPILQFFDMYFHFVEYNNIFISILPALGITFLSSVFCPLLKKYMPFVIGINRKDEKYKQIN